MTGKRQGPTSGVCLREGSVKRESTVIFKIKYPFIHMSETRGVTTLQIKSPVARETLKCPSEKQT